MRFPNLSWALDERGLANYQAALKIGMAESRFSRCLHGRTHFTPEQRDQLASFLGYPAEWLFREIVPPRREVFAPQRGQALDVAL